MKRIRNKIGIVILITILTILPVKAANYEIRELIPVNIETSINTKHFSYRDFYYNDYKTNDTTDKNNYIVFKSIKNISDEEVPVSISIGLFDKKKKNIGTINYCSKNDNNSTTEVLKPGEEKAYAIEVKKDYLGDKKTVNDIKYISVLSENSNCRITGSKENLGQTVEEIGIAKNNVLDSSAKLFIRILTIVGIVLAAIFVYNFMFTNAYQNIDGKDVRQGYQRVNQELKKQREYEERVNPKPIPEKKKTKTDKVLAEEEAAAKEKKDETDLHNLYK